jgi:hypothetical protein
MASEQKGLPLAAVRSEAIGTSRTWRDIRRESVMRSETDIDQGLLATLERDDFRSCGWAISSQGLTRKACAS